MLRGRYIDWRGKLQVLRLCARCTPLTMTTRGEYGAASGESKAFLVDANFLLDSVKVLLHLEVDHDEGEQSEGFDGRRGRSTSRSWMPARAPGVAGKGLGRGCRGASLAKTAEASGGWRCRDAGADGHRDWFRLRLRSLGGNAGTAEANGGRQGHERCMCRLAHCDSPCVFRNCCPVGG